MEEKAFPVKIGLEIHGYLDTVEKLFCMCRTDSLDSSPNSNICPICTGTPGSKPMAANEEAVRKMLQVAEVFGSKVNFDNLIWQRKHYDWADNPKGFQTTMSGAHATVNAEGGEFRGIKLWEMHLEEDPAQWNPANGWVDYNRSGLPLIEIVTEPGFKNSEQVVEWLRALVLSLSYIKAIRKNAGIKVDVNVSTYGGRVEMKNLNSLEKIRKAIDYEVMRQIENHEAGEVQGQETRAYDEVKGKTVLMRSKENAADYRFIPCPDLPTLKVSKEMAREVKENMPEMPDVKLDRLLKEHSVSEEDAKILIKNLELVDFFEELVSGDKEKVILVDAVHCLVDSAGNVNEELKSYLDSLPNRKIVLTMAPKEKFDLLFGNIKDYELFTTEFNPKKDSPKYYEKLLARFGLNARDVVYFEHSEDAVKSAKSVGIDTMFYEGDVQKVKDFVDAKIKLSLESSGKLDVKRALPWVTVELLRVLNYNKKSLEDVDVEILPVHLAELIKAVEGGEITKLKGKQIMNDFVPKSFSLAEHREEVSSISAEAVENLCRQVVDENAHVVEEYKGGKEASLNFLIGQVMRLSERRADFREVTEVVKRLLG